MQALNVMKEVGKRWQAIDIASKREYERKSDEDKRRYNDQYREYQRKIGLLQQRMKEQIKADNPQRSQGDYGLSPPTDQKPAELDMDQKAAESLSMVKKSSESPNNHVNHGEPLSSRSNDKPIPLFNHFGQTPKQKWDGGHLASNNRPAAIQPPGNQYYKPLGEPSSATANLLIEDPTPIGEAGRDSKDVDTFAKMLKVDTSQVYSPMNRLPMSSDTPQLYKDMSPNNPPLMQRQLSNSLVFNSHPSRGRGQEIKSPYMGAQSPFMGKETPKMEDGSGNRDPHFGGASFDSFMMPKDQGFMMQRPNDTPQANMMSFGGRSEAPGLFKRDSSNNPVNQPSFSHTPLMSTPHDNQQYPVMQNLPYQHLNTPGMQYQNTADRSQSAQDQSNFTPIQTGWSPALIPSSVNFIPNTNSGNNGGNQSQPGSIKQGVINLSKIPSNVGEQKQDNMVAGNIFSMAPYKDQGQQFLEDKN